MTANEKPVVDFDHHSKEYADGWRAVTADLRKRCPVAWTDAHDGYWVASSYDAVRQAALDDETFSSDNDIAGERHGGKGTAIPSAPLRLIPLEVDPPLFTDYRKLLNPLFSPSAAEPWRPFLRQVTNAMIDRVCEKGELDIVHDIASPIPAMLTMSLLGLPLEGWERVATPFHEISWAVPGSEMYTRAIEGLFTILGEIAVVLKARKEEPREDLLTFLAHAEIEGRPLTEEEAIQICFLQLIGGVDTSTGLLSHSLAWLADHPDDSKRLVEDPAYLKTATEEFLRWASPAPALARTVTAPTTLGGQSLCPGDRLLLSWASANQDATVFDDPETVQLDRTPNRHQAFGLGAHRCLGSNLGRVQFQEILVTTLSRLPDLRADVSRAERYPSLGQVNGYSTLPATFTPTKPVGASIPESGPPVVWAKKESPRDE